MKENVGRIDRLGRGLLGPTLIGLGYTRLGGGWGRLPGLATMIAGAMLVETAITRVCPLNTLLGIDTRSKRERARDLGEPEPPRMMQMPVPPVGEAGAIVPT